MGHVSITINGRQYRVGCEDGQEDHLVQLGRELDRRTANLRGKFGEIGDTRLTLMAAVVLLDELAEARARISDLEQDIADLHQARSADVQQLQQVEGAMAAALDAAATRIDRLSRQLNAAPDPGTAIAMG